MGRKTKSLRSACKGETDTYAVIYYRSHISTEWHVRRVLKFVIFDESILQYLVGFAFPQFYPKFSQMSGQEIIRAAREAHAQVLNLPIECQPVSDQDVAMLVNILKCQSMPNALASAIESRSVSIVKSSKFGSGFTFQPITIDSAFGNIFLLLFAQPSKYEKLRRSSFQIEHAVAAATHSKPTTRHSSSQIYSLLASAHLRERIEQALPGFVLVYRKTFQKEDSQAPERCIFSLGTSTEPPNIREQLNIISNLRKTDGFYTTSIALFIDNEGKADNGDLAKHPLLTYNVKNIWRPLAPKYPNPVQALLHWRTMLSDISMIHEISKIANMQVPELSRVIKRSVDCAAGSGKTSKRTKLDVLKLKEELKQDHEAIESD